MKFKVLAATVLSSLAICTMAQETTKDLQPLLQANKWNRERNAVQVANETVEIDGTAAQTLKLTYLIDYKQKDGSLKATSWPYAQYPKLPAELNDWSPFQNLKMKIRAQFSRADAEIPFHIAVIPTEGKRVDITEKLVAGKWIDCTLPLSKFDNPQSIKEIKFFLNSAKYNHEDVVTVEIAKLQLTQ